ncbi:MAG: hypothetical protein R2748_23050 [Bryobacterales bacterium]
MENEPLRWGYTYWQAFEMVLPNLALQWESTATHPLRSFRRACGWRVWPRPGTTTTAGAGVLGRSRAVHELWGRGVVGYFALLAVALVWCDRLSGARPTRVAVWAMALGPLLWTARNAYTVFVRPAVWGALLVFAAYALSRAVAGFGGEGVLRRMPRH